MDGMAGRRRFRRSAVRNPYLPHARGALAGSGRLVLMSEPPKSNGNGVPVYYADYLHLDALLSTQRPRSGAAGQGAHDEMLFIIVHQVHELWFRQILHEVESVRDMFHKETVDEKRVGVAVARLERVREIQKSLIETLRILETMTSLDFLDFRDMLSPASGFQSYQFRLVENRLGLNPADRVEIDREGHAFRLNPEHRRLVLESQKEESLFDLIEAWLERTPFLEFERFDFLQSYRDAVDDMLQRDEKIIRKNPTLTDREREIQLHELEGTRRAFLTLFDREEYERLRAKGERRMSYRAMLAAIFINLYRDQPVLHLPFRLLETLVDIDETFTMWRYRHAVMVHRMIGRKIGTGGSSGHRYLRLVAEKHQVFRDLFDLSTYLIPRSRVPPLPADLVRELGFYFTEAGKGRTATPAMK
jgi:tryptophan 2,3-dioxygenase